MRLLRFPFKAKSGMSGVWIEDAAGVTILDFNPLIVSESADLTERAINTAELMAASEELLQLCRWARVIFRDVIPGSENGQAWLKKADEVLSQFDRKYVIPENGKPESGQQ